MTADSDAPLWARSATALVAAIRSGEVTSLEVVDACLRRHTDNALFGATVNPWDAGRTPGGSSGGEAAAIATGMTPFGVGNDYGGSVRLPAHANGVCGLKPTPGRIPVGKPGSGLFGHVRPGRHRPADRPGARRPDGGP